MRRLGFLGLAVFALVAAGCGGSSGKRAAVLPSAVGRATTTTIPPGATRYRDPDGWFTMAIDPSWETKSGVLGTRVAWSPPGMPGVVVAVAAIPNPDPGAGPINDAQIEQLSTLFTEAYAGAKVISHHVLRNTYADRVFDIEIAGNIAGNDMHIYEVISVGKSQVAVAVLATQEQQFADVFPVIQPFVKTIRAA